MLSMRLTGPTMLYYSVISFYCSYSNVPYCVSLTLLYTHSFHNAYLPTLSHSSYTLQPDLQVCDFANRTKENVPSTYIGRCCNIKI